MDIPIDDECHFQYQLRKSVHVFFDDILIKYVNGIPKSIFVSVFEFKYVYSNSDIRFRISKMIFEKYSDRFKYLQLEMNINFLF